jgi:cytochrome c biogenesis protein CcmG, thiol:disulfide interchange protein DsbE
MTPISRLLCLLGALLATPLAGAVEAGAPAPAFTLPANDGTATLEAYRGKYVYLDFWASWCAPCRRSFPWMNALQQHHGDRLKVIAVNVDAKRADAERFLAANPAAFTVAFDGKGELARRYAVKGMPASVLIDPAGKVVATHAGFTDKTTAQTEAALNQALGQAGASAKGH